MSKKLKDIIYNSDNIFTFSIKKENEFDKRTWSFIVTDQRSDLCGFEDTFNNYIYNIITLKIREDFFIAYKLFFNKFIYFVDMSKSGHKTSSTKYVNGFIDYCINSNDISEHKDSCSFRVANRKMKNHEIDNYLDLCYYFRNYSSVGIGLTRMYRNLIVLDIDVDCRKEGNKNELDRLLNLFALNNMLPDFEIHNNKNGHIQLQWLIQSFTYKKINKQRVNELIKKINESKDGEINFSLINFNLMVDADDAQKYRIFTKSLTDISDKPNFGDKNFTYWKAKNFCTALFKLQNLELKMPQYKDGKIFYLSQFEMVDLFSKKENRKLYFDEAPTFNDIVLCSKSFLSDFVKKEKEYFEKNDNIEDDDIFKLEHHNKKYEINENSRNNFVFKKTKELTWEICREKKYKSFEEIAKLSDSERKKLKNTIHKIVKNEYNEEDKKYGYGKWPGTSNETPFTKKEFENAFNSSFNFAISNFKNLSKYNDEQREKSLKERELKKDMKIILVDYIRNKYGKMKKNQLLNSVNDILEKSGKKKISLSSLKRYITKLDSMNNEDKRELYYYYCDSLYKRKEMLLETNNSNKRKKKEYDYISINIIDDIIKKMNNL